MWSCTAPQAVANDVDRHWPAGGLEHRRHRAGDVWCGHRCSRPLGEQPFLPRGAARNGPRGQHIDPGRQELGLVLAFVARRPAAAERRQRRAVGMRVVGPHRDHQRRCRDGAQRIGRGRDAVVEPRLRAAPGEVALDPGVEAAVDHVVAAQAQGPGARRRARVEEYLDLVVAVVGIVLAVIDAADDGAFLHDGRHVAQPDREKADAAGRPDRHHEAVLARVPGVDLVGGRVVRGR